MGHNFVAGIKGNAGANPDRLMIGKEGPRTYITGALHLLFGSDIL